MSAVLTGSNSACFDRNKKRDRKRMEPFNQRIVTDSDLCPGPGIWKQVQALSISISYVPVSLSLLACPPLPPPFRNSPPNPKRTQAQKMGPSPRAPSLRPASVQKFPPMLVSIPPYPRPCPPCTHHETMRGQGCRKR